MKIIWSRLVYWRHRVCGHEADNEDDDDHDDNDDDDHHDDDDDDDDYHEINSGKK